MLGSKRAQGERPRRSKAARALSWLGLLLVALVGTTTAAPELLAWPYRAQSGDTLIYSVRPIPPEIDRVVARTDRLLAQSPLDTPLGGRRLFLTDGGWRWSLLALTRSGAFALRRPLRDAVIVNRSDVAADRVENGAAIGGRRTLSGIFAHELTHILVARRYGEWRAATFPTWKSEGYADHVAGESSLSEAEYHRLRAHRIAHPALAYFEGRRRVEARLRRSGGDPDALFLGD